MQIKPFKGKIVYGVSRENCIYGDSHHPLTQVLIAQRFFSMFTHFSIFLDSLGWKTFVRQHSLAVPHTVGDFRPLKVTRTYVL